MLLEPASIVAKAWDHIERIGRRARSWEPRRLLVTGAGPVGLLAALMGQQRGFEVHVLDRAKDGPKPRLVRDLGATYHTGTIADVIELAPDIVIECTGAPTRHRRRARPHRAGRHRLPARHRRARTSFSSTSGSFNRTMVLNNDVVFGSVNANRRHYELAAEALANADQALARPADLARACRFDAGRRRWSSRPDDIKVVIDFTRWSHEVHGHAIEDYALIGDCETAALVGARRLDRLAVLAALRFRRLLRRAARHARATAAGGSRRDAAKFQRHAGATAPTR